MLLRLLITNQQLPIPPIPSRFLPRNFHDLNPRPKPVSVCRGRFAEDGVHFFEGAVGGFGVEEVDDGEDEGVDYGEDDVGFISWLIN